LFCQVVASNDDSPLGSVEVSTPLLSRPVHAFVPPPIDARPAPEPHVHIRNADWRIAVFTASGDAPR
jgi:hypothetical protein